MNQHRDLIQLDNTVWVLSAATGILIYDFDFRSAFPCRQREWGNSDEVTVVGRMGAFSDYVAQYAEFLKEGIRLVHTPEEHLRASQLPGWYPLIENLTPRSQWFEEIPKVEQIESEFDWPVFIKGIRQTSHHQRKLSIVESADDCRFALEHYQADSILGWQSLVVREYVPLRQVEDPQVDRIPSSFEFRTFWWQGTCVGAGRYWWEGQRYDWTESEKTAALELAVEAAKRVAVPFLVIDLAMTNEGKWTVIECNDGQESGYAGASPIGIWQNIIDLEHASRRDC
ncbi:MAG: ATP-grasp domain-containing protein [Planctomycetota bacterium]